MSDRGIGRVIKWIDVVSARLRQVHGEWLLRRGPARSPHMRTFEAFSAAPPVKAGEDFAVVLFMSSAQTQALVMHAGVGVRPMLPNLNPGSPLDPASMPYDRVGLASWPRGNVRSGQPSCERGMIVNRSDTKDFEVLTLPFHNDSGTVSMIYTVFDIPRSRWKETAS